MKCFVYKQKRKKNGKQAVCRLYRGRYRIDDDETFTDVSLGVSDKQVALAKLKIVRRIQQERAGILPSIVVQQAFSGPLDEYLKNFAAELRRLGRDDRYVTLREASIQRLFKECKWKLVTDIQPDSFIKWRQQQTSSPKTLNDYLLAAKTLMDKELRRNTHK